MSSTFGGLQTSYRGLSAANQGIGVTGQNIANVGTPGYTRQRMDVSATPPVSRVGMFATPGATPGQGVNVDSITRMGNTFSDARVRTTLSHASNTAVRAEALSDIEGILGEPGKNGLSHRLNSFFASWQDVSNNPNESAPSGVLLEEAGSLAKHLGAGYLKLEESWDTGRNKLDSLAAELNDAASRVADLNSSIRSTLAAGGSANELIDQRNNLTTHIATLAGGTVRETDSGEVEVLIGGNAIVSGDKSYPVKTVGARNMAGAAGDPPRLEWSDRSTKVISLSSGEIAGTISTLAPANETGTGGSYAESAASFNALSVKLASTVNDIHHTGVTADGRTDLDFFTFDPDLPAAKGLEVAVGLDDIASRSPGTGGNNGSIADAISQAGKGKDSPGAQWSNFVTKIGVESRSAIQSGILAENLANSASDMQIAGASVSLDEESMNLLTYQHAYQASARVMSAIDEMLQTIINLGR